MRRWIVLVLLSVNGAHAQELTPLELSRLITVSLNAACLIQMLNPVVVALTNFVTRTNVSTNVAHTEEVSQSLSRIRTQSLQLFTYLVQIADGTLEDVRLLVERAHLESSRETLVISYSTIPMIGENEAKYSSQARNWYFLQTSTWGPVYLNLISTAHQRLIRFKNYIASIINGSQNSFFDLNLPIPQLPDTILYAPAIEVPTTSPIAPSEPSVDSNGADPTFAPYL